MPNSAPAGTSLTRTVPRSYTLHKSDFGFSDGDGDAFEAVVVASLPSAGTLYYDSNGSLGGGRTAVIAGQTISAADILAGKLTFVAAAGASGADYAHFDFQVQDDGGTAVGGVDLDPVADTLTFDVLAVYDPPATYTPTLDLATLGGAGFKITGDANFDAAGSGVSGVGDINGDGFADIVVGAPLNSDPASHQGAAYVIFGHADGFGAIDLATPLTAGEGFKIVGAATDDRAGVSVSGGGDVNGDGFADIIVGATRNAGGGFAAGAAYVIFGHAGGFGTIHLATLTAGEGFKIQGAANEQVGYSVSATGDVNGDGFADVIVSASGSGGSDTGAAYVIFGHAGGFVTIDLATLTAGQGFKIVGEAAGDIAGISVSAAGDVNGDGFADVIVGAVGHDSPGNFAGAAYVIFGHAGGFGTIDLATLTAGQGFKIQAAAGYDYAGRSVSAAGDVNGDGIADIIVGAHGNDDGGDRAGAAYVIFGHIGAFGTIDLAAPLDPSEGFKILGDADGDAAGYSVSAAGDFNGDGFADILVGAVGNDSGGDFAGATYLIFGHAGGFGTIDLGTALTAGQGFKIQGEAANDALSRNSPSAAGDLNGDGYDDIIVSARGNDGGGARNGVGAAYVIFGHDFPPAQGANAGLTLDEGATGTITSALLDYDDLEQADSAIVYTITSATANGTLELSGGALGVGGSFTQDDIDNNRITYVHDGSETTSDAFGFSVSDGAGGDVAGQSFAFTIDPVNDAATLSADIANLTETNLAADIGASGSLTISDPDSAETFVAQAGTVGTYGTFAIDAAGAWTYTASSAHDEFVDGQVYTDIFSVSSADSTATSVTINITGSNDAPLISNYDNVIAASGTGPIDLRIAAPTDPEGDPVTITLDTVPGYGLVEYFDGASWIAATGGETLSAAELVSLRYTPPAGGEFGGEAITYSASDGTATAEGVINIISQVVAPDPLQLLFAASDDNAHNPDLYTVDGSGVLHNAAINPPNGSFPGDGSGFIQFGGDTYFTAVNGVASFGGLFRMDSGGTAALVDAGGGAYFGSQIGADPHFTTFAGGLYFAGDVDGAGTVAIRLDADGSHTSFSVNGTQQNAAGANGGFVEFDGSLYFSAITTLTNLDQSPNLIRLDADGITTEISTRSNPASGSYAGEDGGFIVFNNALYFNAYGDAAGGDTLFRLDAGSTTPVAVDSVGNILSHTNSVGIDSAFHIFAGSLYFNEFSFASGADGLFKLDDCGCLNEITYFNGSIDEALVNAGALGGFVEFAGSLYFTASTSDTGIDLFRLDDCGCLEAIDVNLGPADAFGSGLVSGFAVFGGALYFDAYDGTGDHLYRLDDCGCLTQVDLGGGGTTNAGVEGGFQQAFGSLFFSAYTGDGYEVVRLEQDGAYSTYDINPGPGGNAIIPGDGQTFGLLNANLLTGTGDDDIIAGSAATETLSGGGGNDVLESRGGNDHLAGGDGADLFVLSLTGAANLVSLDDYDFLSGDKVDLSALLDTGFGPNSSVSDFARLFAVEGDLKLQIDADGTANGTHWTDVAILTGGNSLALDSVEVHFNGADYTLTESFEFNLQTVTLAGGGWAVTWSQPTLEDGDLFANVFGRVFDSDGHQVGGTFQISADDNGMDDQYNLVAALPNGDFAVVWQACENEIWTRVYHADGMPVTGPEAVQPPDLDVFDVKPGGIVALSNGGYAVLWTQGDSPANGFDNLYVSTFAADGTPVSGPVLANSPGAHDDGLPLNFAPLAILEVTQIVQLANGFAVTWLSERATGPGGDPEESVFVRVFDNAGNPISDEIQANSIDGGNTSVDGGLFDSNPELVALGGNDFALQWESESAGGEEHSFVRIFDDAGYTAGAPVQLDANVDPNVLAEIWDVAPLVNGGFATLWGEYDVGGSDVRIQIFDASGAIAAGSAPGGLVVNQVTGIDNLPDQVLALAGGGFAVLYDSDRDDGTGSGIDTDVYVRTYAANGTPASNELRVNPADDIDNNGLALAALPNGGFVVLWAQQVDTANGSRTDILARIVGADGTPFGGPIMVGSSPSDLSYAEEQSLLQELRDAVSANGDLLVAWISDDTVDLANFASSLSIALLDTPPAVDLDGAVAGIDHSATYTENGAGIPIGATIAVSDANAGDQIVQAVVTLTNAQPGDLLSVGALPAGISAAITTPAGMIVITLSGAATPADYAAAIAAITYDNGSDDPAIVDRVITVLVNDGAADSNAAIATIQIIAQDDAPVVRADSVTTDEATVLAGSVFSNNGAGADSDVDGPPLSVSAVNGSGANVGVQITLASGAHLTLNAGGTFTYDPNHAFDETPGVGSGASNMPGHDSFTYTLAGGGTATVSVTINGIDSNDTLIGTAADDTLNGGIGADIVNGLGGNDLINGGAGADTMTGGSGNDTYVVDDAGDQVIEASSGGNDIVYAVVSYGLAAGSEVELLSAFSTGWTIDMNLTGNEFDNVIVGTQGANILYGGSGGLDVLVGLGGDDTYIVDGNDVVLEDANGGADTVYAVSDYTLRGGSHVELLSAFSTGWTIDMNLTGNEFDNAIVGTQGANILYGGSAGADVLVGLGGNDTYIVDGNDVVLEDANGGNDIIYTVSDYTLGAGSHVELLSAFSIGWTSDMNLTGNTFDNIIVGTQGANILYGGGGGLDVLVGLGGNDTYVVDSNDIVFEDAIGGSDVVYAVSDYTLGGGSHVELLSAFSIAWMLDMNLTGNTFDNIIVGTRGANILDGKEGNDYLVGFSGADTFDFTTALNGTTNVDRIEGFETGVDKIALDHSIFGGLGLGALAPGAFVTGSAAQDADDRIIYDSVTGNLYYDADGNGGGAAVQFATLQGAQVLTATDFQVI